MNQDNLQVVKDYHQATKHHFHRYARSLGHLDWATQPVPFRHFDGSDTHDLVPHDSELDPTITWDSLFGAARTSQPVTGQTIGQFLYHSLALSAWKEVIDPAGRVVSRWALRVNPSSGNLHPTEGYLVTGPVPGLVDEPGVFHYAPDQHLLERRARLTTDDHEKLRKTLPDGAFLVGLSSIHWREAWKYGERAFRYCQHDVGHAMAALGLSGRCLGWEVSLLPRLEHPDLEALLGTGLQSGPEKEHADCLLLVRPAGGLGHDIPDLAPVLRSAARGAEFTGLPNPLSPAHARWPIIDQVAAACAADSPAIAKSVAVPVPGPAPSFPDRGLAAGPLIRQRRSAVSMDGATFMDLAAFQRILERLLPRPSLVPYSLIDWPPEVSLVFFVHRVTDLDPGLYCLVRHPDHEVSLRANFRPQFAWARPGGLPADLPFFQLASGDTTAAARQLSCGQDIAADGAFSVGMLARFSESLDQRGAGFYPHLFRETGMIGQMLYLEAEAANVRGTGIGCFFDDEVHRALGLDDDTWQSLYHFTVGAPVPDDRLRTVGAYDHLKR
jgi:SagB-type dehydrogenase family enzyme